MLSVLLACAFISRQFWGVMADRVGGLKTVLAGSACQALAIGAFLLTQNEAGLFAIAAAYGLGFQLRDWQGKLMALEMADPTPALDTLVELGIRPMMSALEDIVRMLLGPAVTEEQVERCAGSIVGQCLHYKHAKPVIVRMGLWRINGAEDVAALAAHIVAFSLGGIARIQEGIRAHE